MKNNLKKDFFWNTIGSICYSFVSILLSTLVVRIVGKVEGGIFAFGFSTLAQQIFCLTYFGGKTSHIIDVNYKHTFYEYKCHRYLTTILSIFCGLIYLLVLFLLKKNDLYKSVLLFVLIFHGIIEGFYDVYEAEYQREGYLYIAGKALFYRTICWTLVFLVILFITKNLLLSSIFGMITEFALGYICDTRLSKKYFRSENLEKIDLKNSIICITKEFLPLFIIIFLDSFVFMAHKFVLENIMGDTYIGLYTFLFLPANGIYLLDYLMIRPILSPLSDKYLNDKSEYKKFLQKIIKYNIIISVVVVLLINIFSFLYIDFINIFTNNMYVDIMKMEVLHILFITLGGAFYATYNLFYYIYIIENRKSILLKIYMIVAICSLLLSIILIKNIGFVGASMAFMANTLLLMGIVVGNYIKEHINDNKKI